LLVSAVCIGLFGLIPIVTGVGLWQMKSWAWWVLVILQSIGLAFTVLGLCSNLAVLGMAAQRSANTATNVDAIGGLVGGLVGGAINGGILYWFIANRSLFGGGGGAQSAQGAPAASGSDTGTIVTIVLGLVGIVIMIPIVIIIILALLGPAIGNVFSNILLGL